MPPPPPPVDVGRALALNCALLFVAESSRGLVLPTLNAYCRDVSGVDGGASGAALAVSVFSVGRLVAAPLLGVLADAMPYRTLFVACAAASLAGHALYVGAASLPPGGGAFAALIASRFVLGVASGVLGPCRAVVSVLTAKDARTRAYAVLSTAKFVGYALMPFAGSFSVRAARVGGGLVVSDTTMPGLILAAANAAVLVLAAAAFDPRVASDYKGAGEGAGGGAAPPQTPARGSLNAAAAAGTPAAAEAAARAAARAGAGAGAGAGADAEAEGGAGRARLLAGVGLFLVLNALGKGVLTQLEVFLSYLYQQVVTGPGHEAEAALWLGYLGLLGLLSFAYLTARGKGAWPPELALLAGAFLATGAGAALLARVEADRRAPSARALLWAGAALAWSAGAPVADVLTTSLFSVVVDGRAAGKWLGLLTMSGSVGRIVLPLAIAALGLRAALVASAAAALAAALALLAYAHAPAAAAACRRRAPRGERLLGPGAADAGVARLLELDDPEEFARLVGVDAARAP